MPRTPLVLAFLLAAGGQVSDPDPVAQFRDMEKKLAAAYVRGDRAFVDGLLADDWTSTDYLGRTWTKARVMAMFDGPRPPMTKAEIDVDTVGCSATWRSSRGGACPRDAWTAKTSA